MNLLVTVYGEESGNKGGKTQLKLSGEPTTRHTRIIFKLYTSFPLQPGTDETGQSERGRLNSNTDTWCESPSHLSVRLTETLRQSHTSSQGPSSPQPTL